MLYKRILTFAAVSAMLLFTSCTFPPEYVSKADNKKKIEEVMELIAGKDKEKLIEQFSNELRNDRRNDLEAEIDEMFLYLNGEIVSYDEPKSCGYSQKSTDHGNIKLYVSSPIVKNVKTESGQILSFLFTYTVIDDEDPEKTGIEQIRIFTQEDNGDLDTMQININGISDE